MARKFLTALDLTKLELQNARIQNLATAPSSPAVGQIYFDTVLGYLRTWTGTEWVNTSQGIQGTTGTQGAQGTTGSQGTQGLTGAQGTTGTQGTQGITGSQGTTGETGAQGTTGETGAQGTTGTQGAQGPQGTTGLQGLTGLQGTTGSQGTQGVQGETGSQGTTGTQGLTGLQGTTGSQGTQGVQGPQGTTGIQGTTGTQGVAGSDATVTQGTGILVSSGVVSIDETYTATRAYVDSVAQGLHVHESVVAATTTNLTATYDNGTSGVGATLTNSGSLAAFSIDGVSPAQNARILVKDQTTQTQNGIYTLTTVGSGSVAWVLTRATDFNEAVEIDGGDFVFVTGGTSYNDTGWVQSETGVVIGTNNIIFTQFSGAGTYLGGAGLTLDGNTFNVGAGTGITVNANDVAVTTSIVARKYSTTIGNGSATSFTITHNFNTRGVMVSVYSDSGSYDEVECDVEKTDANTVTLRFATAPTSNQYAVAVIG